MEWETSWKPLYGFSGWLNIFALIKPWIGFLVMRLNRKVEYALIALKHFAGLSQSVSQPQSVSSREISRLYETPFDTTAQVLRALARGNILSASQGAMGGYALAVDLNSVSLYQVQKLIMGPLYLAYCLSPGTKSCELKASCQIQKPVEKLNRKFEDFLKSLSIGQLVVDDDSSSQSVEFLSSHLRGMK